MTTTEINATLAQWHAQEATQRAQIQGKAGVATAEQLMGKTGLEVMQAMITGDAPYPHIADTMDFCLIDVAYGTAIFQGTPQTKHLNPMGGTHGGWYATILDSALGCAVHTTMPAGQGYTTAELSVNIVRAAKPGAGPLRAIGTVLHSGRQLATAEARIVDAEGKLYAHATTTCLVFGLKT